VETSSQEKLTPPREPDLRIEERRSMVLVIWEEVWSRVVVLQCGVDWVRWKVDLDFELILEIQSIRPCHVIILNYPPDLGISLEMSASLR
jgi:hypothetical protein